MLSELLDLSIFNPVRRISSLDGLDVHTCLNCVGSIKATTPSRSFCCCGSGCRVTDGSIFFSPEDGRGVGGGRRGF